MNDTNEKTPAYNARTSDWYNTLWKEVGKCVFCDLKEKYIIAKNDLTVLTVNIFPYIEGHLLIIPKRHFEGLDEMTYDEWISCKEMIELGEKCLKEKAQIRKVWTLFRNPKGFKAAKTVAHVHIHLIPYSEKLFKWEYQNIDISPEDLAKKLKD